MSENVLRYMKQRLDLVGLTTSVVLIVAGLLLLWLGIHLESGSFWQDHPFLTNVVSGATTACFGVPIALIILSRLYSRQAATVERQQVAASLLREVKLISAILDMWIAIMNDQQVGGGFDAMVSGSRAIESARRVLLEARLKSLRVIKGSGPGSEEWSKATLLMVADSLEFRNNVSDAIRQMQAGVSAVRDHVPTLEQEASAWISVRTSWRVLHDRLLPRANELGVDLSRELGIDPSQLAAAQAMMNSATSPIYPIVKSAHTDALRCVEYWEAASEDSTKLTGNDRIVDRPKFDFAVLGVSRSKVMDLLGKLGEGEPLADPSGPRASSRIADRN